MSYYKILIIFIFSLGFILWSNHYIRVSQYLYTNSKIPKCFDGFRIIQISDLHADLPKWKLRLLINRTKKCNPNIIVITGDLIDHIHSRKMSRVLEYIDLICEKYSVYYVTGNHEYMHAEGDEFLKELSKRRITILHNESMLVVRGDDCIEIIGVDDPYSLYNEKIPQKYKTPVDEYKYILSKMKPQNNSFSILLSHRPEFFETYVDNKFDIVFSGHAHGGQWRIPGIIKGIIAPDQGFFPKYSSGAYKKNETTMYVSRGLGNSVIPFRLFNLPEVVEVILCKFEREESFYRGGIW